MGLTYFESELNGDFDHSIVNRRASLIGQKISDSKPFPWLECQEIDHWLSPLGIKTFNSSILHQTFFHFRSKDELKFNIFFSLDALGHIISEKKFSESDLKIISKDQKHIKLTENFDLISHIFNQQGSFVANNIQNFDENISKLQKKFALWSGRDTHVNCYLTPPKGKTFPWHWDSHDVFILQIHGAKVWKIFDRPFTNPLVTHHYTQFKTFTKNNSKLLKTFRMNAGDMLYIPRGFPHMAKSSNASPSLHLTIGFSPISWHAFMKTMVDDAFFKCENDILFRLEIGNRNDEFVASKHKKYFAKLAEKLFKNIDFDNSKRALSIMQLQEDSVNSLKKSIIKWNTHLKTPEIQRNLCMKKSGILFFIQEINSSECELIYGNFSILFPKSYFKALNFISKSIEFYVKQIPSKGLPKNGQVELAKLLHKKGLICAAAVGL